MRALVPRGLGEVVAGRVQAAPYWRRLVEISLDPPAPVWHGVLAASQTRVWQGLADPPHGNRAVAMAHRYGIGNGTGLLFPCSLGRLSRTIGIPLVDGRHTPHARSAGRMGSPQAVKWLEHP